MMKHFLRIAALLALFAFPVPDANAACVAGNCFGIATGNWGTSGTWSATSGGVTCACTPTTGDNIIFDAGSNGKTFTMEAAYSLNSLVMSGATTATWTQNAFTLTITGNTFTLLASATYTPTAGTSRLVSFTSTSGTTAITSAGKIFAAVLFNGVGGTFQLQDNLTVSSATGLNAFTLTAGTASLNAFTLAAPSIILSGSTTRVVNCGSGGGFSLTALGATTPFDISGTGVTTDGNCVLTVPAVAATSGRSINLGTSLAFAAVTITGPTGATSPQVILAGTTPTITTLTLNGPLNFNGTSGTTTTVTNFNVNGTSALPVLIAGSSTVGTVVTFAVTASTMTWAVFLNVTFTTSAVSPTNCINVGGNTFNGGTCSPPSTGGGGRIIGG